MQTVHKYTLPVIDDPINLAVPRGAEFLDAQPSTSGRPDQIDVWFKVNPTEGGVEHRVFIVRGTGHPLPPAANTYRATCVNGHGPLALVWHLFEVA